MAHCFLKKNLPLYIFLHETSNSFSCKSETFFFFFTFSFLYMKYISSHPPGTSTSHIPAQVSVCQRPSPTTVPEFLDYLPYLNLVLICYINFILSSWYVSVADVIVLLINLLIYFLLLPPGESSLLLIKVFVSLVTNKFSVSKTLPEV